MAAIHWYSECRSPCSPCLLPLPREESCLTEYLLWIYVRKPVRSDGEGIPTGRTPEKPRRPFLRGQHFAYPARDCHSECRSPRPPCHTPSHSAKTPPAPVQLRRPRPLRYCISRTQGGSESGMWGHESTRTNHRTLKFK
jgi:hypothetical protein